MFSCSWRHHSGLPSKSHQRLWLGRGGRLGDLARWWAAPLMTLLAACGGVATSSGEGSANMTATDGGGDTGGTTATSSGGGSGGDATSGSGGGTGGNTVS